MDRTTEPVIAVLGHPIAGNATQFALERAFATMQIDWRVLSFDVEPSKLHLALDGLDVLGVEGVLIDPSLSDAAKLWARTKSPHVPKPQQISVVPVLSSDELNENQTERDQIDPPTDIAFDILFREHSSPKTKSRAGWSSLDASGTWLADTTREHFESRGRVIERWARLGTMTSQWPDALQPLLNAAEQVDLEPDSADTLNLIIVSLLSNEKVNFDDWPRSDLSTLVLDTAGHIVPTSLTELGYRVVTAEDLQVGMLGRCLSQWTGQSPPLDVLREAIEEYSAV